jgi:hypothetical protein
MTKFKLAKKDRKTFAGGAITTKENLRTLHSFFKAELSPEKFDRLVGLNIQFSPLSTGRDATEYGAFNAQGWDTVAAHIKELSIGAFKRFLVLNLSFSEID